MSTVLITGAHGFLGRYTALYFKKRSWRIIGMGHGHWGFECHEDFGIDRWIEGDIDFYTLAKIDEKLDCVVHCAGGSSVGYSVQYPLHDFNKTVNASINLLEYLRIYQPRAKIIYPSSAAVYGKKDNQSILETTSLGPISPYGFHKKIVEELCASYCTNFNLSVAVIRFFSVYGPGLKKQLLWDACNKFSKAAGKKIVFLGTGEETRDWLHVKDAAALLFRMAESSGQQYEIINGGSGVTLSVNQVLTTMAVKFKNIPLVAFNHEFREGDPKHYWADISKAKQKGWLPKINIELGLQEYVEWYEEQKNN